MTPREVVARAACRYRYDTPCDPAGCGSGECDAWNYGDAILAALAAAGFAVVPREEVAAQVAAARREGIEAAARAIECGCSAEKRALVTSVPPNSGTRWHACGEPNCAAIEAAAIRALLPAADAALARDFAAWTEGESDG